MHILYSCKNGIFLMLSYDWYLWIQVNYDDSFRRFNAHVNEIRLLVFDMDGLIIANILSFFKKQKYLFFLEKKNLFFFRKEKSLFF